MISKKMLAIVLLVIASALLVGCSSDDGVQFPIEITDSRIEVGGEVYLANCASCHGPVDGPVVIEGSPIHNEQGHTWHHPDRLLFGYVMDRPPLATIMPAFRETLSEDEVLAVLAYIKSHWPAEIQQQHREGSAQYEAQVIEFGME